MKQETFYAYDIFPKWGSNPRIPTFTKGWNARSALEIYLESFTPEVGFENTEFYVVNRSDDTISTFKVRAEQVATWKLEII